MRFPFCVLLCHLGFVSQSEALETVEPPPGGTFFEAFDELDLEQRWEASHGWSNGSHQRCEWREENLAVADGRLVLSKGSEDGVAGATCAEIQSREVYGHGTYEISMRPVAASGTVSAFFTYIGEVHGKPHDEIDFEFLGKNVEEIQLNFFVGGEGDKETFVQAGEPDSDGFFTLAFEWTQDGIRWFVDGTLVRETAPGELLPSNPSKIYMSFWSGTSEVNDWLGPYDDTSQPSAMEVKWVSYTAPGEYCPFPESITCAPGYN